MNQRNKNILPSHFSRCSFLMMVKRANDGLHHANDGEMLVNDVYPTLISPSLTSSSPSLTSILPSLAWSKPPLTHLTIIEKLHQLHLIFFDLRIYRKILPSNCSNIVVSSYCCFLNPTKYLMSKFNIFLHDIQVHM